MDAAFWHRKWAERDIGFHESEVNPLLHKHFPDLALAQGSRVFLPLCGKTLDIHWLLSEGYRVVGAELSRSAVEQLFAELKTEPTVCACGLLERYGCPDLDVFVGDFFDLSGSLLGPVDAIYDRAALVALPFDMRERYATHLTSITAHAPQLLICLEYDPNLMKGPPFPVAGEEVARHYGERYTLSHLERIEIPAGFKGKVSAAQSVWLLEG